MSRIPPTGTVIRFIEYHLSWGGNDPVMLGPDDYMWGQVYNGGFRTIYASADVLRRMGGDVDTCGGSFDEKHDKYVVVPEDEWPDELCAYLAKKALLDE